MSRWNLKKSIAIGLAAMAFFASFGCGGNGKKSSSGSAVAYEVRGLAYDGLGNEESALENFKEAKRLDASINIPEKYAAKMNS